MRVVMHLKDVTVKADREADCRSLKRVKYAETVDRTWINTVSLDGEEFNYRLFNVLAPHIRKLAKYYHNKSLGRIPAADFESDFWVYVWLQAIEHRYKEIPLLYKIDRETRCKAIDKIRWMNAQKRRPYFFETDSLDDPTRPAVGSMSDNPEFLMIQAEEAAKVRKRFSDLLPVEQEAVKLRLQGKSYDDITVALWPDIAPHPEPARRMFIRIRKKMSSPPPPQR